MPPTDPNEPLISSFRDDPEMAELVGVFVREMPERLGQLERAWREGEVLRLTRLAHQLKGCSAGYGFEPIGKAAAALESGLRDLDQTEARLADLEREFSELMDLCSRACAG